ncbi:MAG: SDR family oxidoreductase [Proteobacteria bacterium]|nr:SDR family oxidoreductase [Pseudomonadota bacterium]
MTARTALIAGATGAAAKRLIEVLLEDADWQVIGLSRHPPATSNPRLSYLRCDLSDREACARVLAGCKAVTHVFYTARAEFGEGGVEDVDQNVAMLRNVFDALEAASPDIEHVHLVEGQKWYDVHLRPARLPTREDDPLRAPPNFYYDQEHLLRERQHGRAWTWSASRPYFIYDYAPERARNLVSTIGAWAALCAERGSALDFPGSARCYAALTELSDATQLARAIVWMAGAPAARNQAYNVSDGCQFRWQELWPRIAAHFGLQVGEVRPLKLAQSMADQGAAWERIVRRHALQRVPMQDLVSWNFADFLWGLEHDNTTSLEKIRHHGFGGAVDTGEQLIAYLQRYRESRLLP